MKKLSPNNIEIGTYTTDTLKIVGSCKFYLVHLSAKKLQEVTFFVARNDGSLLLSCTTTLLLGLVQPRTRLDYLPPRASLITSSVDHPKKTRCQVAVHSSTTDSAVPPWKNVVPKQEVPKLGTSKEQILSYYPDILRGWADMARFPYSRQLDPSVTPKQTPWCPIPVHLKGDFQQKINKMLQVGVLKLYKKPHHGSIALFL